MSRFQQALDVTPFYTTGVELQVAVHHRKHTGLVVFKVCTIPKALQEPEDIFGELVFRYMAFLGIKVSLTLLALIEIRWGLRGFFGILAYFRINMCGYKIVVGTV